MEEKVVAIRNIPKVTILVEEKLDGLEELAKDDNLEEEELEELELIEVQVAKEDNSDQSYKKESEVKSEEENGFKDSVYDEKFDWARVLPSSYQGASMQLASQEAPYEEVSKGQIVDLSERPTIAID